MEAPRSNYLPSLSIVIPCWDFIQYTQRCVETVMQNTVHPVEIILVDNGSKDGTREWIKAMVASDPRHFVGIYNDTNLGFSVACNQGMNVARGHVLLLNNDTEVLQSGALDLLLTDLTENPKLGAVGPVSNAVMGVQDIRYGERYPERHLANFLVGFCMLIRKEARQQVGFLDEQRFSPACCEDLDYSIRLIDAGWDLGIDRRSFIYHHLSISINRLGNTDQRGYGLLQAPMQAKLLEKHGQARIDRMNSPVHWGKYRVMMGIPCYHTVDALAYANHMGAIWEMVDKTRITELELWPRVAVKSSLVRARNELADMAIREGMTHLFFMDDDMLFQSADAIPKLLAHGKDIVSAGCVLRSPPHYPSMFFDFGDKDGEVRYIAKWPKDALIPVDSVGMACCMISVEALKKIKAKHPDKPFFEFGTAREGERNVGEDLYFCKLARDAGVEVYVDTGVQFGHIGSVQVLGYDTFFQLREQSERAGRPFPGAIHTGVYPAHKPGTAPEGVEVVKKEETNGKFILDQFGNRIKQTEGKLVQMVKNE